MLCHSTIYRLGRTGLPALVAIAVFAAFCSVASAQTTSLLSNRAVGGVVVTSEGALQNASVAERNALSEKIAKDMANVPNDLIQKVPHRPLSLRQLEAKIAQCMADNRPLSDSVRYLGGLQKIRYVIVDPDQQDVILVGPAEAWKVTHDGTVVGTTSAEPVLLLDDLIIALRSAATPKKSLISCSIDPSQEGLQRLRSHVGRLRTIGNPHRTAMGIEQQLGPQQVSVTGVPETSHFARVMVAADYRMKRVSMNLEPAPVADLPSFMTMMQATGQGMRKMLPRWWLAPDYQPLVRDAEGLVWELRGATVKAMAENDFLDATGVKHQTGKADPVSKRWANQMTSRYEDLSKAEPVFGQLRNCMDLAVVAALIVKEDLTKKANLSLPSLMSTEGLQVAEFSAPRQIDSKAALVHKGRKWMIACGGVEINPWEIVGRTETSDSLSDIRDRISTKDNQWLSK